MSPDPVFSTVNQTSLSFVTDQCELQVSDFMANDKERDATADEGLLTQVIRIGFQNILF